MSSNQILIVIHGMGSHTDESFKKEIINAANKALTRYDIDRYKDKKFEDFVQVLPVSYDEIFEKVRQRFVQSNKPIAEFLASNPDIGASQSIIQKASNMQAKLGDDDFLQTHALDVLLYLTNVGEWVRIEVGEKITQIVHDNPNTPINFLAHSLGTDVLHDTLSKIMKTDAPKDAPSLDPNLIKFNSLWLFANVSRLLNNYSGQTHPYQSIVKPGDLGCTRFFFNIRHVLDPFTRPMMFDPKLSDNWVKPFVYKNDYFSIVTESVSRKNTHSIAGYIEDPKVSIPFLRFMMNFKATSDEIVKGNNKFKTIDGEFENIKDNFKHIDKFSDLNDFLELLKDFKEYAGSLDN
jgi:hypothetical protein